MYNLILADFFKLRKSFSIKILIGITTVSAVIMTIFSYLIPLGKIDESLTGLGFMFSDINMISILGAVVASVFICGDYENKTIHDAIANGYSRGIIIISKAIVFFCAIMFILLPYAIITLIAIITGYNFNMGSVAVGFLHIMTTESGTVLSPSVIGKLVVAMLTLVVIYVAQLSICVPLALILKKQVLVVAIYYGLTIFFAQLTGVSEISPAFKRIFSFTPYGSSYTFVTLDTGAGDIIKAILVSLIFIIVTLTVTYGVFKKSEIK